MKIYIYLPYNVKISNCITNSKVHVTCYVISTIPYMYQYCVAYI